MFRSYIWFVVVCAIAATAVLATLAGASVAGQTALGRSLIFSWRMESRFVPDSTGRLREIEPEDVPRGPWRVGLQVTGVPCTARGAYHWFVDGKRIEPIRTAGCAFATDLPREGKYTVVLKGNAGGKTFDQAQLIRVQDFLIVSIGDSVGSGESVPDVASAGHAQWNSARCHRSGRASPARVAARIEADDPHSSVTFVHLACSGATIPEGLLGHYAGAEPPVDEPALPSQLHELEVVARRRTIDAVILNVGANDVHFGDVVRRCASYTGSRNCFDASFTPGGSQTTQQAVDDALRELAHNYARLARRLSDSAAPGRVHVVEYFDPTTGRNGKPCGNSVGLISAAEMERAQKDLLGPLNKKVGGTGSLGWDVVGDVAKSFRGHGYCAGHQRWVTKIETSFVTQGGHLSGRLLGTLHPNNDGQQVIADLVAPHLELSLFGRVIPQRPPAGAPPVQKNLGATEVLAIATGAALFLIAVGWVVASHEGRVEYAVAALLIVGGTVLLALAFTSLDERTVARQLAAGGGVAIGAGAVVLRRQLRNRPLADAPEDRVKRTVVTGIVLALGLVIGLTLFAKLHGFFLALALVVGGVLGSLWGGGAVTTPLPLPRAGAPALLPLLTIVALGTVKLPLWVPVIVGSGLAFAATRWIVRPEVSRELAEITWVARNGEQIAVVALLVVAMAGAAGLLLKPVVAWFQSLGGVPVALLFTALVLWLVAIVLRLVSYSTTGWRLAVAVALLIALLRGLLYVGVAPGHDFLRRHVPVLDTIVLIACALVVLGTLVWRAFAAAEIPDVNRARGAAGLGLATALLASVMIAGAAIAGMVDSASRGSDRLPPDAVGIKPQQPSDPLPADDDELAADYSPVLGFTAGERWTPVTVESYLTSRLADTRMLGPGGKEEHLRTLDALKKKCPGRSACWHLTIDCPEGKLDCSGKDPRQRGDSVFDGAAYVRIVRRDKPPSDGSRNPFTHLPPELAKRRLSALIQYWFFYRYDEWRATVLAGRMVQRHEGDWEAVMVGVADQGPLFVAYSAHCGGSWRSWKDIHVSGISVPYTHPLVAVAEGSHANYPEAGARSPNWASCSGMPDGTAAALSYASNVRERTDYAWQWAPRELPIVDANDPPMSFPGTWGLNDRSLLENFAHHPTSKSGAGPKSPPLQRLWNAPLETVFCNKYWHGPEKVSCREKGFTR